jgi:L-ascorbate metabolism protein UlaG (beta-lactamase superfamily)
MKKILLFLFVTLFMACKSDNKKNKTTTDEQTKTTQVPVVTPIQHASFVMEWGKEVIYLDPVGKKNTFENLPEPTLVIITDIHGDHFNEETLEILPQTFEIIAPYVVFGKMSEELKAKTKVLKNGELVSFNNFDIEAIPMYNLTEDRKQFHEKGRGNGYLISNGFYRVYISGDTEDIPEMRQLRDIDLAFVCMNLPYTMHPEIAADAVLDFMPKKVIPYHYRGLKDGNTFYYNVKEFRSIVNSGNSDIEVEFLDWYPNKPE